MNSLQPIIRNTVLLLALSIISGSVSAQCNYARSSNTALTDRISAGITFLTGGANPTNCAFVSKNSTSGNLMCSIVVTAAGQYNCPTNMGSCRALLGFVQPTTNIMGPHTCKWTCNCDASVETFTMSNIDGLPVELMEFSIEPDSSE